MILMANVPVIQKKSESIDWFLYNRNIGCYWVKIKTEPTITCSKLTIETLEQGVKYVQS